MRRASREFFGGGPFASWFLGFVRSREYRQSTNFQLIPVRGSAPSSSSLQQQHFTADSSSSWDAVSIAAISCSERVLHLPCARIGALILIISCTHICILRLIKWLSVLVFLCVLALYSISGIFPI